MLEKNAKPDMLSIAVKDVYGPSGTFDSKYSGGERERALGTLTACASLVNVGSHSAASAREVILLLRANCVGRGAEKWRLGAACVKTIAKLVSLCNESVRESVAKLLWGWCEERKLTEDGLLLTLTLRLDFGIVSQAAFEKLYPDIEAFREPVMEMFSSGFSYIATGVDGMGDVVPEVWKRVVKFAASKHGAYLNGLTRVWERLVVGGVLKGGKSTEKKLLAMELMLECAKYIHDVPTLEAVFCAPAAENVNALFKSRKISDGKETGPGRMSSEVHTCVKRGLESFSTRFLSLVSQPGRDSGKGDALIATFLLWCVKGGIQRWMMPTEKLRATVQDMRVEDVTALFRAVLGDYACPSNANSHVPSKWKKNANSNRRPDVMQFALTLATIEKTLLKDAVRVFAMYTVFERHCNTRVRVEGVGLDADLFDGELRYGGVLPLPQPELSRECAYASFKRLLDVLVEHESCGGEDLTDVYMQVIRKVVASEGCGLRLRSRLGNVKNAKNGAVQMIENTVLPLMKRLEKEPEDAERKAVWKAIRKIGDFLVLYMCAPSATKEDAGGEDMDLIGLCDMVGDCVDAVYDEGGDGSEEEVECIERVSHLIAEMCGRESSDFRKAAGKCIGILGEFLDDRVVAVLFDAMEGYLAGDGLVQSEDEEDGDGEDIEMGEAEEGDKEEEEQEEEEEGDDEEEKNGKKEMNEKVEGESRNDDAKGNDAKAEQSDEDEVDAVNMDADDEDPAVLAAFDARLTAHLRLIERQKRSSSRRRHRSQFRFIQCTRILTLLEQAARLLRMRLARSDASDKRTGLVLLDLHTRLYEFGLGDAAGDGSVCSAVAGIVKGQLGKSGALKKRVGDKETCVEIARRFLKCIGECSVSKRMDASFESCVTKSGSIIVGTAASMCEERWAVFGDELEVVAECIGNGGFASARMLAFVARADVAVKIRFVRALERGLKKASRHARSEAVSLVKVLCAGETERAWWVCVESFVRARCVWKEVDVGVIEHMICIVADGVKCGGIREIEGETCVREVLKKGLNCVAMSGEKRGKLMKSLRGKRGRDFVDVEEEGDGK